jgi:hypothetical protein
MRRRRRMSEVIDELNRLIINNDVDTDPLRFELILMVHNLSDLDLQAVKELLSDYIEARDE